MSLGIERANHLALCASNPEAAAEFAVSKMGLQLAKSFDDGSYYLKAHGLDPFSLIYKPGESGIDHVSFTVRDVDSLNRAEETLQNAGVEIVNSVAPSREWNHGEFLRFRAPGDLIVELTVGVYVEKPMAALVRAPSAAPAPIAMDHVVTCVTDTREAYEFWTNIVGLKESARISTPDDDVLTFLRAKILFHCYAIALSGRTGLHHYQFSVKDPIALYEAHERMKADGVNIVWGPLRHGPGHNIAFYIRDEEENIVEYSCEEEIILHDETYRPRRWDIADPKSLDEWGSQMPDDFMP